MELITVGKALYLSSLIIFILLPQVVNAGITLQEVKTIEIGNYDSIFSYGYHNVALYSNQSGFIDIYDGENLASPTYVKTLNVSDTPIQGIGTTPGSWFYYLTQNDTHCILNKYGKDNEQNTLTRSYSDGCYDSIQVSLEPVVVGFHHNSLDVYDASLELMSSFTMMQISQNSF